MDSNNNKSIEEQYKDMFPNKWYSESDLYKTIAALRFILSKYRQASWLTLSVLESNIEERHEASKRADVGSVKELLLQEARELEELKKWVEVDVAKAREKEKENNGVEEKKE